MPKIAKKRQEVQKTFFKNFERDYATAAKAIEKSWSDMEDSLRTAVSVQTEVEVG